MCAFSKKSLHQEGSDLKGLHLELVIDNIIICTIVDITITSASNFFNEHNLISLIVPEVNQSQNFI